MNARSSRFLALRLMLSILVFALSRNQRLSAAVCAFLTVILHIVCDLIGSRGPDGYDWPIFYLYPVNVTYSLSWAGQWQLNAWPTPLCHFRTQNIFRSEGKDMKSKVSDVDAFINNAKSWKEEIQALREILLECGLDEALKWGKPCYIYEGRNLAIIQPFKNMCALLFFKGALFKDAHGLLRSQGQNTQSALRLEFVSCSEIKKSVIRSYVAQAIEVEKAGLKVDSKTKGELELPEELSRILSKDKKLAKAFFALTPGRQRAYVLHFSGAKQSATRTNRIEKSIPKILAGKGIND